MNKLKQALLCCLKKDCAHCPYRESKNDLFNCAYQKDAAALEFIEYFERTHLW